MGIVWETRKRDETRSGVRKKGGRDRNYIQFWRIFSFWSALFISNVNTKMWRFKMVSRTLWNLGDSYRRCFSFAMGGF